MALLPQYQSKTLELSQMQNTWGAILNPIIANPLTNPTILKDVKLISGDNTINSLLGRKMQGWFIADINAAVQVYRSAPFNDLTLTLNSSGPATATLVVF